MQRWKESLKGGACRAAAVAVLAMVLCAGVYAWITRSWTPSITQENIRIASADALVISLTGEENLKTVSLNELTGIEAFVFRQVSGANGTDFFRLSYPNAPVREQAVLQTAQDGFVRTSFFLKLDPTAANARYIFLHSDTGVTDANGGSAAGAIRISLCAREKIYILRDMDGAHERFQTTAAAPGAQGLGFADDEAWAAQEGYDVSYFNGTGPDRSLMLLHPGDMVRVDMCIWLEGGDEGCVNDISDETLSLAIKFDSVAAG